MNSKPLFLVCFLSFFFQDAFLYSLPYSYFDEEVRLRMSRIILEFFFCLCVRTLSEHAPD